MPTPFASLTFALALAGATVAPPALADAGHDHGDAPVQAQGAGLPRFAATSDLFELVGIVDGKRLTIYLDRATDNAPVAGAKVELELGGVKVELKSQPDGVFEATLAQAPKPGVTPVTATVVAGQETDLLAGELKIPEVVAPAATSRARDWKTLAGAAAAGLFALAALVVLVRRISSRRALRSGGAA